MSQRLLFLVFTLVLITTKLYGCDCDSCCCGGCGYQQYNKNYDNDNDFAACGLDIYVFDSFLTKDDFLQKYKCLYTYNYKNNQIEDQELTEDEKYYLDRFFEDCSYDVLNFSNHHQEWRCHVIRIYLDNSGHFTIPQPVLDKLLKQMGTDGGNNFDIINCQDKPRWFERFRSKERHNKNILIVGINGSNCDGVLTPVLKTFKKMKSFSYCPEIIYLNKQNINKNDFYKKIDDLEKEFCKTPGDFGLKFGEGKGDILKSDKFDGDNVSLIDYEENNNLEDSIKKICQQVSEDCYYHNNIGQKNLHTDSLNILITGWKRSGKTTLSNRLVNGRIGKSSNDHTSVTRKISIYDNKDKTIKVSIVDTPGIEEGQDYAGLLKGWLFEPVEDGDGNYIQAEEEFKEISINVVNISDGRVKLRRSYNEEQQTDIKNYKNQDSGENVEYNNADLPDKISIKEKINDKLVYYIAIKQQNNSYKAYKVKLNKDFIHCVVHVISNRNFLKPNNWNFNILNTAVSKPTGPLWSTEEVELFKLYKDNNIPVVFTVNFTDEFYEALMYMRKTYGDLAMNNYFFNREEPHHDIANEWIGKNNIRGTIINLVGNDSFHKCGVVRLLQSIFEIVTNNLHKDKLPQNIKENDCKKLTDDFTKIADYLTNKLGYLKDNQPSGKNPYFFHNLNENNANDHLPLFDLNQRYNDKLTDIIDDKMEKCFEYLNYFATTQRETLYYNAVNNTPGIWQSMMNNFAIGNKYLYAAMGLKLTIINDDDTVVNNNENGWHEANATVFA